jgi:hypothetical protein
MKKPGKGEGGEAIEDILAGGLAYFTRQTGVSMFNMLEQCILLLA